MITFSGKEVSWRFQKQTILEQDMIGVDVTEEKSNFLSANC